MKEETSAARVLVGGKLVLFPHMRSSVHLRTAHALATVQGALKAGRPVALFANRFESPDEDAAKLHPVGTLALVRGLEKSPCCGQLAADLEGMARVRIASFIRFEPYPEARCSVIPPASADSEAQRLALEIRTVAARIQQAFPKCFHAGGAALRLVESSTPEEVLGAVGGLLLHLHTFQRQQILELEPLSARLETALVHLLDRLARSAPPTVFH